MAAVTENVQQPLRYIARELDPLTGLYYVRNRWYDPVTNRFVSEGPIGLAGGINLYAYALNSPTNLRDPMGLDPTVQACIAQLTEQRNEGSLTWTNEQIRKACGAGNGSIALPGVAGSARWDPFAQGNATLLTLMGRTDAMAGTMSFSLGGPWDGPLDLTDELSKIPVLVCAADQFGLTALGAGLTAAGQPIVAKRFRTPGSSGATSPASRFLSGTVAGQFPRAVWAPTTAHPFSTTRYVGRWVGRWTPFVGEALLVYDGVQIYRCVRNAN
jgi:RHS repeat-associated protein